MNIGMCPGKWIEFWSWRRRENGQDTVAGKDLRCRQEFVFDSTHHSFDRLLQSMKWRLALIVRYGLTWIRRILASRGTGTWTYRRWIRKYEVITPQLRASMIDEIAAWPSRPLISIIMPSYNIDPRWLRQAIDSVRNQIYPHWELCISDDASTLAGIRSLLKQYAAQDSRIHVTFRPENGHISVNSNGALDLAHGEYVALVDADDCLSEDALFWVARELALHPETDLLFSDEDKIDAKGRRFAPYFKSAWNPALMLSQNAFSHLGVYRRRLVEEIGGFRSGYEGSQDHDLVLRCAAKTTSDRVRHIPRVLYHWRALPSSVASSISTKSYAWNAGRLAIADYLRRSGIRANVKRSLEGHFQLDYDATLPPPLVSILVPTTLSKAATAKCLVSVLTKTTYKHTELILLVRATHLRAAKNSPNFRELLAHPSVRAVTHEEAHFNFSRVNNIGARSARGGLLCFLNDDIEVITPDWLERLVARVTLDGVGAVGPMLYYPSGGIQHAGVILGVGGVADHAFKRHRRGYVGYFGRAGLEQDYSCLTAACLIVRREIFDAVGGFDETLPVAFNDVDLCIKIRRTGARLVWTPSVEMYHHESLTFGHHASSHRRSQFSHDVGVMRERWKTVLANDPCYNPNLSLVRGSMFCLAWPPRLPEPTQIIGGPTGKSISRTSNLTFDVSPVPQREK